MRPVTDPRPDRAPTWPDTVRRLLVHARALGASLEEAEDLVHDTLEVVLADPAWLDPDRDPLPALKVVLRNRWLNRVRAAGVAARNGPRLVLVREAQETPETPITAEQARAHRRSLLASLTPDERALFAAWLEQRAGRCAAPAAAARVGLDVPAYEAAKKRLRRRCEALLGELGLDPGDLFGGDR